MRYMIFIFLFLVISNVSYADRVCIVKSTGKLIEYQSGDSELGSLKSNAINAGYREEDIEEKYVTSQEWMNIRQREIVEPMQEEIINKENARKEKENRIKAKLGLNNQDFNDLKEALNANIR